MLCKRRRFRARELRASRAARAARSIACPPRSTPSAASPTISARSCTIRRRAPAPPSTHPRRRRSSLPSTRPAGRSRRSSSPIAMPTTCRESRRSSGATAAASSRRRRRAVRCRPSTPMWRRATRCGSASFRPMSGKRPATAGTTSPTGSRPTGRCLPATRCSRSAAAASWNRPSPRCGARSRGSRRCPARRGSIAATTTSCQNGKFALAVEPDNAALKARMAEAEKAKAEGRFLIPSTIGAGEGDEPLPARRRAVGRPRRQDGGRRSRQGVPGAARMEEPVLTADGPGRA